MTESTQKRRIVVGFSGGVTSAWCAGWALRTYPREEVVLLFNDTREEDADTYRFIRDMAAALGMPVTERSDGRSVTEVFYDNGALANNRMAFCSRILKAEVKERYFKELRAEGVTEIVAVVGFSAAEPNRLQRGAGAADRGGYTVRFPVVESGVTKQECADWVMAQGVRPPNMYRWSEHANCVGCARGGRAYWLKVAENAPEVFEQRAKLEEEFGHTFCKGTTLRNLVQIGLKRAVKQRESIEIGACECGD